MDAFLFLTGQSSADFLETLTMQVYELDDIDDSGGGGGGGGFGNGNGGGNGNGNRTVTSPIVENGVQVLEAKTSFLGKLWATVEPREWTDRETGFVYQVDADGKIMGLRPLGGLGALGYINGSNGVKLLVQFGKTENQIYHTFRHVEKMGLDKTIVQSAIMKHFQTVYKEIKTGESLNKVITVQGQQIQYSAYRLSDGTINIGRIHGIK